MKKLNFGMIMIMISLFLASCAEKSYKVGAVGNTNVDPGIGMDLTSKIDDYNTYAFTSQVDNKLEAGIHFLNDLALKAQIRDAVMHELEAKGYEKTTTQPDFVVNFRVFDEPVTIENAFDGLGGDYWDAGLVTGVVDSDPVKLDAGSLIIHILDRETGKVVWQGYTSGLMDGNVFDKDEDKIVEAVSLVMDRFNHRGDNL